MKITTPEMTIPCSSILKFEKSVEPMNKDRTEILKTKKCRNKIIKTEHRIYDGPEIEVKTNYPRLGLLLHDSCEDSRLCSS